MAEQPAFGFPESISENRQVPLGELALFFLRLGTTAFGGSAAHIAIMEDELVRRRQWLSREKFLDLLGASNLIPGPSSSELAIHIGYLCAGWRGLLIAGSCFILPAALMVAGLCWLYVRFGRLPATAAILYGIKPVVIGVVVQALLESWTNSDQNKVSWIRGGNCPRPICFRCPSVAFASAGRRTSMCARFKNPWRVLLDTSLLWRLEAACWRPRHRSVYLCYF
jgi:chromate transport protein ChrA